jgi:hypothetical protein
MIMSIFRQGRPTTQLDHIAALKLATTEEDLDLITFAFLHEEAVLTALEQEACIVKPLESGDEGMSFASLYDVAITLRDFNRMKKHNVTDPQNFGDVLYEAELIFDIDFVPQIMVHLKARDDQDAEAKMTRLLKETEFRTRLATVFCNFVFSHPDMNLRSPGFLKIEDPAPADAPEWDIPVD